jgi:hypothetical protein
VSSPQPSAGVWPWVLRGILAVAALAAPIIVFRGLTDSEIPDPVRQQRLREASRAPAEPPTRATTAGRP